MILVHFPSALFPMDLVCSLLWLLTGNLHFVHASFYAMAGGVLLGTLAIIAGAFDLIGVAKEQPNATGRVLIHGGVNAAVVIGYSLPAFIAFRQYPDLAPDSTGLIVLKGCLIAAMIAGNYLGGNLILKDKIGVKK